MRLLAAALAVAGKDVRIELRSRYALNAMLLFAVTTVVVVSFRLGPLGVSRDERAASTLAVLLWVAIFFAALNGLARAFVREEETRTAPALRLAAPPLAVYLGKLLVNLGLLALLETLVATLFIVLMNLRVSQPGLLAAVLALGGIGLAGATTIIAALVAKADGRNSLFAVLAFPLLLPLLVAAVEVTELALAGGGWSEAWPGLRLLAAYGSAQLLSSLLLFETTWES
ncbi:MAG TPA: heme exporter protein CcmB [Herpetosiphonaceae bacterium]